MTKPSSSAQTHFIHLPSNSGMTYDHLQVRTPSTEVLAITPSNPQLHHLDLSVPADARTISPTDIAQFIRVRSCQRYLRLRLRARSDRYQFMRDYDVVPELLPPLLRTSGLKFERDVQEAISRHTRLVSFDGEKKRNDNERLIGELNQLAPGEALVIAQPSISARLGKWDFTGIIDFARFERNPDGEIDFFIIDSKSSPSSKLEHMLQTTCYVEMLECIFADAGLAAGQARIGVIYRGPLHEDNMISSAEAEKQAQHRQNAERYFGLDFAYLDISDKLDDLRDTVRELVTDPDSLAERVASRPFEQVPYHLDQRCDGCELNAFCLKWSAQHDDLAVLPHLTSIEKSILRRNGITTAAELSQLKAPADDSLETLVPTEGNEELISQLAATRPLGHHLNELIRRARRYRDLRGDAIDSLPWIPNSGYSSLPYTAPDHNPNLIMVYIDAQTDYLNDRLYLIGSRVVTHAHGEAVRSRSIVKMAPQPPDDAVVERDLLAGWAAETLRAVIGLAAPDENGERNAPIHLVFYTRHAQQRLLSGLARHLETIMQATPLYDFLTQLAAYDSPIVSYLEEEIRRTQNYPMICQSLPIVARYLKFDWNQPLPFRRIFHTRIFDYIGQLDEGIVPDDEPRWFTARARFGSGIPLEYAYAAWKDLQPNLETRVTDAYQQATLRNLQAFVQRRLEALEHIGSKLRPNKQTQKNSFSLPDLASFEDTAHDLAHALDEFVTIEQHVELGAWKQAHLAPPEERALAGETLLARYNDSLQDFETREAVREHRRRAELEQQMLDELHAEHPDKRMIDYKDLSSEQLKQVKRGLKDPLITMEITNEGVGCSLDEMLALSSIGEGEFIILSPRWDIDSRLSPEERAPYTATYRQLLYGRRGVVEELKVARDAEGAAERATVTISLRSQFQQFPGFLFPSWVGDKKPFRNDELYAIDTDPGSWNDMRCKLTTEGLCAGEPHTLYKRLTDQLTGPAPWPESAERGQAAFLEGLLALHEVGAFHDLEPSKQAYIGSHGAAPLLQVQGPPGTGKSYATSFAVLARLQGAMRANIRYQIGLSCKTHAATDVLLHEILKTRETLARLRAQHPDIFDTYFDPRLFDVPLYRIEPRGEPPEGVQSLTKKSKFRGAFEDYSWTIFAGVPSGMYKFARGDRKMRECFGSDLLDCMVLDEASQLTIPEALLATLPLQPEGRLIVVGDHRQMPPIIKHDWERDLRRSSQSFRSYESLFDTLLDREVPIIRFSQSFRLHRDMANFLNDEIYHLDGMRFFSTNRDTIQGLPSGDPFIDAALDPDYALVVIVHDEDESQQRNDFESDLIQPILRTLGAPHAHKLDATSGMGVVVPHRAQRAALRERTRAFTPINPATGKPADSPVDTVERFQGGEREVIIVSATESDRDYLQTTGDFLLNPRRLTVALSRARKKVILVASRNIFTMFSSDEDLYANALIWKHLLQRTCTELIWSGERLGQQVEVWGNKTIALPANGSTSPVP